MRHLGDARGRVGKQRLGLAAGSRTWAALLGDRRGASLGEYVVLAGLIAIAALAGFRAFGTSVDAKIDAHAACVTNLSCGPGQGDYALTSPDVTMALGSTTAETPLPLAAVTPEPEATPTPGSTETSPSIDDKAWYDYLWNGIKGFAVDGLWADIYGIYEILSDIPGTLGALWDLGRMLVQGTPILNGGPNPFYDPEQAQKLVTLVDVLGETIKDYYVNETDRAVGRTIYEIVTFVIAPAKLLKIAKAKWIAKASKVTKTAEVVEEVIDTSKDVDKVIDKSKDAEKIAKTTDKVEDLSDVAKAWKATGLDIDPVTLAQLEKYGLKPDSKVYRVMEEKYLDTDNMRVEGNPNSMAEVHDPYNLVDNPMVKWIEDAGEQVPPGIERRVPKVTDASKLDKPGLNVAVDDPSIYNAGGDKVKIAIEMKDIIENGGKVYRDSGSSVPLIKPIYVTFDGSVPYTRVP